MEIVKFYFILLLFCLPIFGSNYYVSNQGLNTNSGTQNQPWQTLAFAAAHIRVGDSVLVEDGNYEGFSITVAGDSLNPIVIKALGNLESDASSMDSLISDYNIMAKVNLDECKAKRSDKQLYELGSRPMANIKDDHNDILLIRAIVGL